MTTLEKFNNLSDEFFRKLIKTFPDENKLVIYYSKFTLAKKIDFKKPMELFMSALRPNGLELLNKDEKFFKHENVVNHAEQFCQVTGLVNKWDTASDDIKNSIWEYLQSLYVLGMQCLGLNNELKENILKINK